MRDTNRTKYENDSIDHGKHAKTFVQLSRKGWNSLVAKEYDNSKEHPTPEQLLVREAVKYLTPKQKRVWELYNYDKYTQDEIAKKLGVRQQTVNESIQAIEKRIAKWVKSNMTAYNLLKMETKTDE